MRKISCDIDNQLVWRLKIRKSRSGIVLLFVVARGPELITSS